MDGSIVIQGGSGGGESPATPTGEVTKHGETLRATASSDTPATTPEKKDGDRPAWLPAKFKTAEDFARSYTELETKLGQGTKPETPVVDPKAAPSDVPLIAKTDAAKKLSTDELSSLTDEFKKNGKLSDETFTKLAEKGITREMAETHIAGVKALAVQYRTDVHKLVGGEDNFKSITEWAAANLEDADIDAVNATIQSGNLASVKLALNGLKAQYDAAVGTDPSLVHGAEGNRTAGIQPFRSNAEVTTAMSNPKYQTDEAYRQDVAKRLNVTNFGAL